MNNHKKSKATNKSERRTNAAKRYKIDENDININVIGAPSSTVTVVKQDEEDHGKLYNVYKITVPSKSRHNIHTASEVHKDKTNQLPLITSNISEFTPWVKASDSEGSKHLSTIKRIILQGKNVVDVGSDSGETDDSDEFFYNVKRNSKTLDFPVSSATDKSPKNSGSSLSEASPTSSFSELSLEVPKKIDLVKPIQNKVTFAISNEPARIKNHVTKLPLNKVIPFESAYSLPKNKMSYNTQNKQLLATSDSVNNLSDITIWHDNIQSSLDDDRTSNLSSDISLPEFPDTLPGLNTLMAQPIDDMSTLAYTPYYGLSQDHTDVLTDKSSIEIIPRLHTRMNTDVGVQISPKKRGTLAFTPYGLPQSNTDVLTDQSSIEIIPRIHTRIKTDVCVQIAPKQRDTFTQIRPTSFTSGKQCPQCYTNTHPREVDVSNHDGRNPTLQDYSEWKPREKHFDGKFPFIEDNPSEAISVNEYYNASSNFLVDQPSDLRSLTRTKRNINGPEAYFDNSGNNLNETPDESKHGEKTTSNSIQGSVEDRKYNNSIPGNFSESSSYFDKCLPYFVDQNSTSNSKKSKRSTPSSNTYFDKYLSFPIENTRKLENEIIQPQSTSYIESIEPTPHEENVNKIYQEQYLLNNRLSEQKSLISSRESKESAGRHSVQYKLSKESPLEDSDEIALTHLKRSPENISLSRNTRSEQSSFNEITMENYINPEYQDYIHTRNKNEGSQWVLAVDELENQNPFSVVDSGLEEVETPNDEENTSEEILEEIKETPNIETKDTNIMTDGTYDELNNEDDLWFGTLQSQTDENGPYEETAEEISNGNPRRSSVRPSETKPTRYSEVFSITQDPEIMPTTPVLGTPTAEVSLDKTVPIKRKKRLSKIKKPLDSRQLQVAGTALLTRNPIATKEPRDGCQGDLACSINFKGNKINGLCNLYLDPRIREIFLEKIGPVGRKIRKRHRPKQSEELKTVYLE